MALLAATATLSACLDDPAVRERLGVDEAGRPIGPSPIATPAAPTASPATPGPSATPTAASSPAAAASQAPSASPSAAPGVTGHYRKTFDPLDLAIAGPGYFVLATRKEPRGFEDLLFTRVGAFELAFVATGSSDPGSSTPLGEWRLQTPEGLWVQGYGYQGGDETAPPAEARSTSFQSVFHLGGTASVGAIALDSGANMNFLPRFNFKGQLLSDGSPVLDTDKSPKQVFVAIAQFERPEALKPKSGFPAYAYDPACGVVSVGIAGLTTPPASPPRPIGDATMIRPETLER